MLAIEQRARKAGFDLIIGVDEAGRGPLAGPVVAAAVALRKTRFSVPIRDSKQLTPLQREEAFAEICRKAHIGIGIISETVIDYTDIQQATFFAMNNAVRDLVGRLPRMQTVCADFDRTVCLLIDGHLFRTDLPYHYQTIIRGDESVFSISCASIVAKVTRDRILNIYHRIFPQYCFDRHKGYATDDHRQALRKFGPSLIHRQSFHCTL